MRLPPAVVALAFLTAVGCGADEEPLPRLSPVPDFQLVDQDGAPFAASRLDGEVWVADFVFTRCPSICPLLTSQMGNLARRAEEAGLQARFVSFSVDPVNDTPEVLRAYAEAHGADLRRWTFLTGDLAAMRRAVVEGMRVRMGEPGPSAGGGAYDIPHASHFVLVDRERRIRGYYASDREGQEKLFADLRRLLGS